MGCLRYKGDVGLRHGIAKSTEHRTVIVGLWCRKRSVGVAHIRPVDEAALDYQLRLGTKEGGFPQYQVGYLSLFHRADYIRYPEGNGRIDGDFGDVTKHAEVIVVGGVFGQFATHILHVRGHLEGTHERFSHASHGLRVAGHHREHTHIVQHVFGGLCFGTDATFGKGYIAGYLWIEVVTNHNHIKQFGLRVDAKG